MIAFGDTAQTLISVGMDLERAGAVMDQYGVQTYVPGGYPQSPGGYAPAYPTMPPGTSTGELNTTVPVIPVALGAAAGWYWKKSPLAAIVGAIAGFILGNMFGSVAVQSQVQATPLQPSNTPYGY